MPDRKTWAGLACTCGLGVFIAAWPIGTLDWCFSYLAILVHEIGHSLFAWLSGYSSIPSFDLSHGGGVAHAYERQWLILVVLGLAWGAGGWLVWGDRRKTIVLAISAAVWLLLVLSPLHDLVILAAGHGAEVAFAAFCVYMALDGRASAHEGERYTYSLVGSWLTAHVAGFAGALMFSRSFRIDYLEGKGDLANDFVRIDRDWFGWGLPAQGVLLLLALLGAVGGVVVVWRLQQLRHQSTGIRPRPPGADGVDPAAHRPPGTGPAD
jgi:hypothetical protein